MWLLLLVVLLVLILGGAGYGYRRGTPYVAEGGGMLGLVILVLIVYLLITRV